MPYAQTAETNDDEGVNRLLVAAVTLGQQLYFYFWILLSYLLLPASCLERYVVTGW